MLHRLTSIIAFVFVMLAVSPAWADEYSDTIAIFKNAGESGNFFKTAYGYAVFPTIGKGGLGIGGAFGKGRVYRGGALVGDVSMTQLSLGFQFGGQAYSDDGRKVMYDQKGGAAGLQFYADIATKHKLTTYGFMDETQAAFKAAMVPCLRCSQRRPRPRRPPISSWC